MRIWPTYIFLCRYCGYCGYCGYGWHQQCFRPDLYVSLMEKHKPTFLHLVPPLARFHLKWGGWWSSYFHDGAFFWLVPLLASLRSFRCLMITSLFHIWPGLPSNPSFIVGWLVMVLFSCNTFFWLVPPLARVRSLRCLMMTSLCHLWPGLPSNPTFIVGWLVMVLFS